MTSCDPSLIMAAIDFVEAHSVFFYMAVSAVTSVGGAMGVLAYAYPALAQRFASALSSSVLRAISWVVGSGPRAFVCGLALGGLAMWGASALSAWNTFVFTIEPDDEISPDERILAAGVPIKVWGYVTPNLACTTISIYIHEPTSGFWTLVDNNNIQMKKGRWAGAFNPDKFGPEKQPRSIMPGDDIDLVVMLGVAEKNLKDQRDEPTKAAPSGLRELQVNVHRREALR